MFRLDMRVRALAATAENQYHPPPLLLCCPRCPVCIAAASRKVFVLWKHRVVESRFFISQNYLRISSPI
jgi:hypothetical protein